MTMKKKLLILALGVMMFGSMIGCESIKAGMNAAEETLLSPPETVVTGAKLGLDFVLSILGVLLRGFFGDLFGA